MTWHRIGPMTREQALKFQFDWPMLPGFRPRCCRCTRFIRRDRLYQHLDRQHDGWLSEWNRVLAEAQEGQ